MIGISMENEYLIDEIIGEGIIIDIKNNESSFCSLLSWIDRNILEVDNWK